MRIILIPLEHNEKEELLEDLLPQLLESEYAHRRINVYWESINRYEIRSSLKLGLEDSKLLALFEIILFMIVYQDSRLYRDIYKGTGTKGINGKLSNISISELASNAAKGTQAVINLRILYDEILPKRGVINSSEEFNLIQVLKQFNIKELVINKDNDDYLLDYNFKLIQVYEELLRVLESDDKYNFIDFELIKNHLSEVTIHNSLFDSRFYATDLKEYIKVIRDYSSSTYITDDMKLTQTEYGICCIGSAHVEDLRRCLVKYGFKVNVISLLDEVNDMNDLDYLKIKNIFELYII